MTRLADLLDRYGEAIVYDLAGLGGGWDVLDLWESGRWAFTLALIDGLPRTSAFWAAQLDDDELADEMLPFVGDGGRRPPPPMTEFTPVVEVLAAVYDRLGDVGNAITASAGGKPARLTPWSRPVSALDRARARAHRVAAAELEQALFPHLNNGG